MNIEKWESQVRKGTLDILILLALKKRDFYGYDLISHLNKKTSIDITYGTIYLLFKRLKKDKLIESRWVDTESGMARKYYKITDKGLKTLETMTESWNSITDAIKQFMDDK